mmetsp:Transcript_36713/g.92040  ORF Transcript_36713/g.92040 Transcript_36713/m.92040 type:complete len:258 (+) Transcript_36713:264-1037(+)
MDLFGDALHLLGILEARVGRRNSNELREQSRRTERLREIAQKALEERSHQVRVLDGANLSIFSFVHLLTHGAKLDVIASNPKQSTSIQIFFKIIDTLNQHQRNTVRVEMLSRKQCAEMLAKDGSLQLGSFTLPRRECAGCTTGSARQRLERIIGQREEHDPTDEHVLVEREDHGATGGDVPLLGGLEQRQETWIHLCRGRRTLSLHRQSPVDEHLAFAHTHVFHHQLEASLEFQRALPVGENSQGAFETDDRRETLR